MQHAQTAWHEGLISGIPCSPSNLFQMISKTHNYPCETPHTHIHTNTTLTGELLWYCKEEVSTPVAMATRQYIFTALDNSWQCI